MLSSLCSDLFFACPDIIGNCVCLFNVMFLTHIYLCIVSRNKYVSSQTKSSRFIKSYEEDPLTAQLHETLADIEGLAGKETY